MLGARGISRACAHLLKCVSPGLTFPIAHCYNTRQCTAAIAVRGGNHWKTSQKKQDRPIQTDRQLPLLSPPIRLVAIMPLICFFDGTKSEMIVINSAVLNLWAAAHWGAGDLCLVGRDQGWELRNLSRVTIHEKVPSLSSGVRASATYLNDI